MEKLTEAEAEVFAQAMADYREVVEKNCEDTDLAQRLIEIIESVERKVLG